MPSGWSEITGLPVQERMWLDELAHGLVTEHSLKWVCDMVRERAKTWDEYMRTYGYREYPCLKHDRPFCEECYGPETPATTEGAGKEQK